MKIFKNQKSRVFIVVLILSVAGAGISIASAASTIGTNISTGGTLTVTGVITGSGGLTVDSGTVNFSTTATTTASNGINISDGCFAVDGTCLSSGSSTFLGLTDTGSSFTANRIPHTNSGATALTDTATFVFDGTNLGIGTTTPGSRLHVDNGVDNSPSAVFEVTDGGASIIQTKNTQGAWKFGISGLEDFHFNDGTNDIFTIEDGSPANSLYIDSTGFVGISTSTPGTLLSLGNTGNDTININTTATSTFGSGIDLRTGCFAVNGTCVGGDTSTLVFTLTPGGSNIPASGGAVLTRVDATSETFYVLTYEDASAEEADWQLPAKAFTSAEIYWRTTATSNDAKFTVEVRGKADGEVMGGASADASGTVTDTAKGTGSQVNKATATVSYTPASGDEIMLFKLKRDPTDGSDTLSTDLDVIMIKLIE